MCTLRLTRSGVLNSFSATGPIYIPDIIRARLSWTFLSARTGNKLIQFRCTPATQTNSHRWWVALFRDHFSLGNDLWKWCGVARNGADLQKKRKVITSLAVIVRTFPFHVAFFYRNTDLFAIVNCVLSNVVILPKLVKNHFAGRKKFFFGPYVWHLCTRWNRARHGKTWCFVGIHKLIIQNLRKLPLLLRIFWG